MRAGVVIRAAASDAVLSAVPGDNQVFRKRRWWTPWTCYRRHGRLVVRARDAHRRHSSAISLALSRFDKEPQGGRNGLHWVRALHVRRHARRSVQVPRSVHAADRASRSLLGLRHPICKRALLALPRGNSPPNRERESSSGAHLRAASPEPCCGVHSMTRRLGMATVELGGQLVLFVLFDDGRATCEHVAAGAPSVSSGNGHLSARKHRPKPFTIHRCASCHRRFGP